MNSKLFLREAAQVLKTATSAVLFVFLLTSATASAGVPEWLHNAAQQPQKKYADDANAVTLLDDQETTLKDNGEIVTHERLVFRILRPEGRSYAQYSLSFNNETRINSFRAWS